MAVQLSARKMAWNKLMQYSGMYDFVSVKLVQRRHFPFLKKETTSIGHGSKGSF